MKCYLTMIRSSMLMAFALFVLLFCPCSSEKLRAIKEDDGNEPNDTRSVLETIWGHPWYDAGVSEETEVDNELLYGDNNKVRNGGNKRARGYYPIKPHYQNEHSSSDLYTDTYKHDYFNRGKGYKQGWGGKGYSKKWTKSNKGSKGKKSKSSKSKGYKKMFPPKTQPPRPTPVYTIRSIPNFLIAYVDPLVQRTTPTEEDFAELVDATTAWFERSVRAELPRSVNLAQTRSLLGRAELNAGYPLPRFNILTEYESIDFAFLSYVENVQDIPLAAEINAILLKSIDEEYIFRVVRQIPAFASVNEVFAESTENTFEPLQTISPGPTSSASPSSLKPSLEPSADSTPAPQSTPSLAPVASSLVETQVSNFFIAYVINPGIQPSEEEFAELINATETWFEFVVAANLPEGTTLVGAESDVETQVYDRLADAGQPNLYIEYNTVEFILRVPEVQDPPDEASLLTMLQDSIGEVYLDRAVRPIPAFANAAEAFLLSLDETTLAPATFSGPTFSPAPAGSSIPSPAPVIGVEPTISPATGTEPTASDAPYVRSEPTIVPEPTVSPASGGEPTNTPSSGGLPMNTTNAGNRTVTIPDTFLAFESPQDPLIEPTEAQYRQVIDQTIAFWDTILANQPDYGDSYVNTTVEIDFTQLNASKPEENYNILIDLASIKVRFDDGVEGLPMVDVVFFALRDSIQDNQAFVDQAINTVTDSAFAVVTKAVLRRGMLEPPQEEIRPVEEAVVRVENVYLAYVSLLDPLTEPTEEQYAQIVELTLSYFEKVVANVPGIGASFLSADAQLNSTQIDAGIPSERFNILMTYEYIDLVFVNATENLPTPADTFEHLRNSLTKTYITDYVFTVSNSAFAFVDEFDMGQL